MSSNVQIVRLKEERALSFDFSPYTSPLRSKWKLFIGPVVRVSLVYSTELFLNKMAVKQAKISEIRSQL